MERPKRVRTEHNWADLLDSGSDMVEFASEADADPAFAGEYECSDGADDSDQREDVLEADSVDSEPEEVEEGPVAQDPDDAAVALLRLRDNGQDDSDLELESDADVPGSDVEDVDRSGGRRGSWRAVAGGTLWREFGSDGRMSDILVGNEFVGDEAPDEHDSCWRHLRVPFERLEDPARIAESAPKGVSSAKTPLQFFELMFSPKLQADIVAMSDLKRTTRPPVPADIRAERFSKSDLDKLIAFCIIHGLHGPGGSKRDMWSSSPLRHYEPVASLIPFKRLQFIVRNLAFSDASRDDGTLLFKVAPLLASVRAAFAAHVDLAGAVTVDEQAVLMSGRGKAGLTQAFKNKPVDHGFRVESLNVANGKLTSYCYDFLLSKDKVLIDQILATVTEQSLLMRAVRPKKIVPDAEVELRPIGDAERAVLALFASLVKHLGDRDRARGTFKMFVTMDNYFTRPSLFEFLARYHVAALGTMRKNMIPFVTAAKLPKNVQGVFFGKYVQLGPREGHLAMMTAAKIRGNGQKSQGFSMLSTCPYACGLLADGPAPFAKQPVPLYDFQDIYNHYKVGTDLFDQLRGSYVFGLRYRRWPVTVFMWLLNAAIVNAFLLYRASTGHQISHLDFRESLYRNFRLRANAGELEQPGAAATPVHGRQPPSPMTPDARPTVVTAALDVRETGRHFPVKDPRYDPKARNSRECVYCKMKGVRSSSTIICDVCQVPLCTVPCFKEFHVEKRL